ncbi:peptidylprolyl isomerase [Alicyclobacillus tolerans]|nr:peptidylprolyl isomerase [Alicyclobacillus tolerans]
MYEGWFGSLSKQYEQAPAMQLKAGTKYEAVLHTTEGDFTVELLSEAAPVTVNNFVTLARDGFYNDVVFHRIIKGFMVQTGDPTGTGMGGPGYRFADELPPALPYEPGVVAMANAGPNTNGSQFFVCTGESSKHLNNHPNYTVFGRVVSGMEAVHKIEDTPVGRSMSGEMSQPKQEVKISSIDILEAQ